MTTATTEAPQLDENTKRMAAYRLDPSLWAKHRLGFRSMKGRTSAELQAWLDTQPKDSHQWARANLKAGKLCLPENERYQDEWLKALSINGPRRLYLQTGNGVGKTAALAVMLLWFMDNFPGGVAVTTAGTWQQVENQLWREVDRWKTRGRLDGHLTKTQLDIAADWYAIGLSPDRPETFEGAHGQYMMLIYDEAKAIDHEIFISGRRLLQSSACWWWVVAGTPGNPVGPVYDLARHDSKWQKYNLSAYEAVNCNLDDVAEMTEELGEGAALFRSMICGQFYEQVLDALIPRRMAEACMGPVDKPNDSDIGIGVDVAREGDDRSAIYVVKGGNVVEKIVRSKFDAVQVAGEVGAVMKRYPGAPVAIDTTGGFGGGPSDILRRTVPNARILDVNFGANVPAHFKGHGCLRMCDFLYWQAKRLIEERRVGNLSESVIEELCVREYWTTPSGKLQLTSKPEAKKLLKRSPDEADALCLALHVTDAASALRAPDVDLHWFGENKKQVDSPETPTDKDFVRMMNDEGAWSEF